MGIFKFIVLSTLATIASTKQIPRYHQVNAVFCVDNGRYFSVGSHKTILCRDHWLVPSMQIECMPNGQWLEISTPCQTVLEERGCPDPYGGSVKYSIGHNLGHSCRKGTVRIGSKVITCGANGQWIGTIPQCIPRPTSCADPGIPTAGKRISHFNNYKFEINAVMEFSCLPGYKLRGNTEMRCKANGQWSSRLPKCEIDIA